MASPSNISKAMRTFAISLIMASHHAVSPFSSWILIAKPSANSCAGRGSEQQEQFRMSHINAKGLRGCADILNGIGICKRVVCFADASHQFLFSRTAGTGTVQSTSATKMPADITCRPSSVFWHCASFRQLDYRTSMFAPDRWLE